MMNLKDQCHIHTKDKTKKREDRATCIYIYIYVQIKLTIAMWSSNTFIMSQIQYGDFLCKAEKHFLMCDINRTHMTRPYFLGMQNEFCIGGRNNTMIIRKVKQISHEFLYL